MLVWLWIGRWPDMRKQIECEGVTFEAWPEHGCWYEKGRANEMGALHIPMSVTGAPIVEDMGEIEDRWVAAP
jgi:hypothetical protein